MRSSLLALALSTVASAQSAAPLDVEVFADGSRAVRGELILELAPGFPAQLVEDALAAEGARVIERIASLGLWRVELAPGADTEASRAAWRVLPGVRSAERNSIGEGGGLPVDDTFLGDQWQLENTGQSGGTPGADIRALEAWTIQRGDAGLVVAVLDSGIDFAHPEFAGRALPGFDFVDEDADPTADHPHGVLVTGLLAANADNAFGVSGVDHRCTVLPVKVLNASNLGTSFDLAQGIDYATAEGADVISMSLINYSPTVALTNALAAARAAGAILVACGGNNGVGNADVSWPGASPHTIAVGWTGHADQHSTSSGTGAKLDFVAPGLAVVTVSVGHVDARAGFSGCSAATPVAAGIVSLLLAEDPNLDQDAIYELLRLAAADRPSPDPNDLPGRDDFYGHGRLDAYGALVCLETCVGRAYCEALANSFSSGARILAIGSDVVAKGDFTLHARFAPPATLGLFFMGSTQVQTPFGDGLRCAGGTIRRLSPPVSVDAGGEASRPVDLAGAGVMPGTPSNFQFWFRDTLGGPSGFNLSDGLHVIWQ